MNEPKGSALLIGCATEGLAGIEHDLESMERTLRPRGFAIQRISGPQATRAKILAAYRRLIDDVQPDQPVVIYFSGHGGRVEAPPPETPGPSLMDLQFIAPSDFGDSSPGDFRGITSVELSALLTRLTQRTRNVVVILDCCHAAHLFRDNEFRVKALSRREQYAVLRGHVQRLRDAGELPPGPPSVLSNRNAVRIVACAPEQLAFEYRGAEGRYVGVLTESLAIALGEVGDEQVNWTTVMERVRRRVQNTFPVQRPEVEGPTDRGLFTTEPLDTGPMPAVVALDSGRVRIPCAALLGVEVGDAFEITAPRRTDDASTDRVGTLRIDRVDSFGAEGVMAFAPDRTVIPPGARARRTIAAAPALPVLLPDNADPRAAALHAVIAATPALRPARPEEPWAAEVRISVDGELTVHDRIGQFPGEYRADAAGAAAIRRGLEALARTLTLRTLAGVSPWSLQAEIAIDWGTVCEGARVPLPVAGATVYSGDRVYLSVRNESANPVYVSLIDIGVSGRVTILTDDSPSGRRLGPQQEYVFGYDGLDGGLHGVPLIWPVGLDPAKARPETVLVLVSEAPQNVAVLSQSGVGRSEAAADPRSPLENLLRQVIGHREFLLPRPGERAVRYDAHTVDFQLSPR
ncbi:MAG TPA: caspase family protein [Actinospica sp.]|jgi:hypothetical protein|nr:caspase family protein [Actinospica sp.]